jgi:hypothetical protein
MPSEMPEIIKNEAHARLMNSLWFAAKSLMRISWFVLAYCILRAWFVPVLMNILARYESTTRLVRALESIKREDSYFLLLALVSLLHIIAAWYIKRSIRQCFHYLRVREIVFVLETAYTINCRYQNQNIDINIFHGLKENGTNKGEPK